MIALIKTLQWIWAFLVSFLIILILLLWGPFMFATICAKDDEWASPIENMKGILS